MKKEIHTCSDLFHSEKGELSDCPQPSVSKGPLEIPGVVCGRAMQAAPYALQFCFMATSILFTVFDTSAKTIEVLKRFTYDFNLLRKSSGDFLEMMTRC